MFFAQRTTVCAKFVTGSPLLPCNGGLSAGGAKFALALMNSNSLLIMGGRLQLCWTRKASTICLKENLSLLFTQKSNMWRELQERCF